MTRKVPIKNLLMDNRILVGVGNIYASESLFYAMIHPSTLGNQLSRHAIKGLVEAIRHVLAKAISFGGTTLKDFTSGDSTPGYFQQELAVYGKEGKKCVKCNQIIVKIRHSGRSSSFCHTCQIPKACL